MDRNQVVKVPSGASLVNRDRQEAAMLAAGEGPGALPNAYKGSRNVHYGLVPGDNPGEMPRVEVTTGMGWTEKQAKKQGYPLTVGQPGGSNGPRCYPYRAPGSRTWNLVGRVPRDLEQHMTKWELNPLEKMGLRYLVKHGLVAEINRVLPRVLAQKRPTVEISPPSRGAKSKLGNLFG